MYSYVKYSVTVLLRGQDAPNSTHLPTRDTAPQVMVVSPLSSYYLKGQLAGQHSKILLDTGSALTLVRTDQWKHQDALTQPSAEKQLRLVGVDGNPLSLRGTARTHLKLGGKAFPIEVTVVDNITADVILGMDFLAAEDCVIDVGRKTLSIRSQQITLELHSEQCQSEGMDQMFVACVDTVDVPANSQLEVIVETTEPAEGTWLLEGAVCDKLLVVVARAVVSPTDCCVVACLLNPTAEVVRVHRGTRLGRVERVADSAVVSVVMEGQSGGEAAPKVGASDQTLSGMVLQRDGSGSMLSPIQQEQVLQVLHDHRKAFSDGPHDHGRTNWVQHNIHTGNSQPIRQAPRRIPVGQREEAHKAIGDMLERGVISPSNSPWSSPIVLVRKKDGTIRFCVDYRKLNAVTRKDAYPLPRVDETLDTLAGSQWFSTLDLTSGYWQVEISEADKDKTAFCTPDGLFRFNVMPFGLCNAPATFQRLMDAVLGGLQWDQCLVYLDDIIVLGRSFESHLKALSDVLGRLERAGLRLKPAKCHLCCKKVSYLGHIVSEQGIAVDPSKTKRIATWPVPESTREVQQFMGLANYYRRFIQDFATLARPLHQLTEKGASFRWMPDCEHAFCELKRRLTSAPILVFPDFSKPFILDTDASATGLGAVLSQVGDDGREHVVAFGSRALSKPERQYCVTRRELLAVVHFLQHFRPYLLGHQFQLRTDHGSLMWLRNFREPEGQMARWLERMQEYDFTVVHRPGRKHCNADALSRMPCRQCGRDSHMHLPISTVQPVVECTASELGRHQRSDKVLKILLQAKEAGERPPPGALQHCSMEDQRLLQLWDQLVVEDGVLYRQYSNGDASPSVILQLVVPQADREEIIRQMHGGDTGGHLGVEKTVHKVKERYYWPGHWNDVKLFCKTCTACNTRKGTTPRPRAHLQSVQAGYPMQLVAMDIVGPFPESESGNKYILVVSDYFTKWVEAYGIANQEASTIAQTLVDEFFCRFSPPRQLHSDQGRQFESQVIAQICKLLGIVKSRTSPYHPQSDGQVERFNRTLLDMLATSAKDHPWSWEHHLRKVCFAYNTSVHSTTGFTPFYLLFGRQAVLPVDLMFSPVQKSVTPSEYAAHLKYSLANAYEHVRKCTGAQQQRQKELYDRRVHGQLHDIGELVWLHQSAVPRGSSKKLYHPWTGPYRVLKRLSDANYRIQHIEHPRKRMVVHFDRLKSCHSPAMAEEGNQVPSIPLDEDGISSPTPLPGTTLDIIQDELEDTTGGATEQHHASTTSGVTGPHNTQDAVPDTPRRYPTRARHGPDRYGNFVSH